MAIWAMPMRGWSFYRTMTDATAYDVLGPLPEGRVVLEYRCDFHLTAAGTTIQQGMSLGSSAEPSGDALATGIPLLDRSTSIAFPVPSYGHIAFAEGYGVFLIPVGRMVQAGSRYVVVGTTAVGLIAFTVGLWIGEVQRIKVAKEG